MLTNNLQIKKKSVKVGCSELVTNNGDNLQDSNIG